MLHLSLYAIALHALPLLKLTPYSYYCAGYLLLLLLCWLSNYFN